MKKFSLLLTTFVMILTLFIPNLTSAKSFPDVQSNHWAIKEINYLSDRGIIKGTPEGTFKPSDDVTRGQMALMLDLSLKLEKPTSYNHIFSDVAKGIYYYDSVHKLAHNNIVQRETNYFPDRSLTRAEMAKVLVKTFDLKPTGADINFPDVPSTHWSYNYVKILAQNNITTGLPDGTFGPGVKVTREQFAAFLARVLEPNFRPVLPKPKGELEVHYIDVGQGDATFIKSPNGETILIDGGNNGKDKVVENYLKQLGFQTINYMIATHPDADHVGGLDEVLYAMNVRNVYAPKVSHTTQTFKDFLTAVANKGLTIKKAKSGVTLPINGLNSQFLAPVKEYGNDLNEWSAILKVTHGSKSFLFTGDAESKSENDMVETHGSNLKSDILKPGHHGSKTSSSQPFLDAVKPSIAVISAGAGNRYGHPTQETLAKLNAMSVKVYRTDLNGTVIITSDGSNISVRTER
ncbi:S-layer protein [Bacillus thuringiensis LM1212]|uniref:S-layer homology domain-containing protein n=1 Tax=Bacillus cereus group TaxID=86661 RepID=UPI000496ED71|nr:MULTISPECIES: S-layer homology domain-containing protein [Bacillus cereus group]AXY09557.1 S-layer protein [Bacillus thuringiensis LM1212]QDF22461.1 MBL fold metallo-hydrolase [Bacillus tropicus]QUG95782.1 MBL fold metallo-hydrolase [Bacillus tropicus]